MKLQFGSLRDLVIGMKVVLADGRLVKSGGQVVKNVSGYDMARLHVGGLGTLGVIVEVSFKLAPLPARETTLVAGFSTMAEAAEAGLGIMHSGVVPLAATAFDETANSTYGPLPPSHGHYLAVRLGGRPRTLDRMVDDASAFCRGAGADAVDALDESAADSLWRSLADFGWQPVPRPAMTARVSLLPTKIAWVVESVRREAEAQNLRTAVLCHPGYGALSVAWFPLGGAIYDDAIHRTLLNSRNVARAAGGRMTVDRCPLGVRQGIDVWDDVGDSLPIMRRMKEQYDPKGILNPGRFVAKI